MLEDVEEDILFQKYFKGKYHSLREWEYKYGLDVMGLLYYEPLSKTCLDLLSMILDECINYKTIYSQKKWLMKTDKKIRDYRYNRLEKSGYITITKDGFIVPNISNQKHLDMCYYQDIQTEKENEKW